MTPSLRDNASCDLLRFHRTVLELLAALLLSFFSAPPARGAAPPAPRRPNVILISVDSLRPDHLGSLGYPRDTSPRLDKYFKTGVLYSNAYSVSNFTIPSHAAVFWGMYPSVLDYWDVQKPPILPENVFSLPEIFQQSGYRTGAFVGTKLLSKDFSFDRGFETFELMNRFSPSSQKDAETILHWVDSSDKPFFLFLHTFIVHYPHMPPPRHNLFLSANQKKLYAGLIREAEMLPSSTTTPGFFLLQKITQTDLSPSFAAALYDGSVRFADEAIGHLLKKLDSNGVAENSIVVLLSDHGDELNEHGHYFHGRTLYDETVRALLFIRAPKNKNLPGRIVDQPVSLVDLPPTLLRLAGLSLPPYFQGSPLPPFDGSGGNRPIYAEDARETSSLQAARAGRWKLILTEGGKPELYDLVADRVEKNNLAAAPEHQGTLKLLTDNITAFEKMNLTLRQTLQAPHRPGQPSEEFLKSLRDLGYIR